MLFKEITIASVISLGIITSFLIFNPFKQNTLIANQSNDPAVQKLARDLDSLVTRYEDYHYNFGIRVTSTQNDETLYTKNEDQAFIPASNLKLFPTAAALETLGNDFKWKSTFYADGPVQNGVLKGNLIFKSEGDPAISEIYLNSKISNLFREWANELKKQGIMTISGNFIVDNSAFSVSEIGKGWKSNYEQAYYAALPSSFSINENYIKVSVTGANKKGRKPGVTIYPYNGGVHIVNNAITVKGRRSAISITRDDNNNTIYINGKIGKKRSSGRLINLAKPGDYASEMLYSSLKDNKIIIKGDLKIATSPLSMEKWQALYRHESPELSLLLKRVNKKSNNFMANQLYLTLGSVLKQDSNQANQVLKEFLEARKISSNLFDTDDGCGLSTLNKTTPRQFSDLLQYMSHSEHFSDFYDSFPIAGVDGTLKNVMRYEPLYKNVRGKTGTINNVKSLCGYIHTQDNEMLTFTILANDIKANRYKIYQFNNEFLNILGNFSRNIKGQTVQAQSDSLKIN